MDDTQYKWGIIGIFLYSIALVFSFLSYAAALVLYLVGGSLLTLYVVLLTETPLDWIKRILNELLLFAYDPWASLYIALLLAALHVSFEWIEIMAGFEKSMLAWGIDLFLFSMLTLSAIELGSTTVLDVSVVAKLMEWINGPPPDPVAVAVDSTPPAPQEEVFHVSGNKYTYTDAQNLCRAYGATLATYDQMEESYQKGGEWCEYGWSDNQSAYFPAQRSTWNLLQKIPGQANACGRPGVNGGYIDDPTATFGVNCYGLKPANPTATTTPDPAATEEDTAAAQAAAQAAQAAAERLADLAGPEGHVLSWFNFEKWSLRGNA
jgi:hypothetical protein